jgi:hypothetical protein
VPALTLLLLLLLVSLLLCRPNFENFMSTVQLLKEWGADLTQTKLSAKHIKCPQLPDVGGGGH